MKEVLMFNRTAAPLFALVMLAGTSHGAVINNPGFEVGVAAPGGPIVANWNYDNHAFVTAENEITPATGSKMLKFLNTSWAGPGGVVSDVFQAIDFSSPADQAIISAGGASLTVGAVFNRVMDNPVPSVVDTRFRVGVYAATSFANAQSLTNIGFNYVDLYSDSSLNSWEALTNTMALPVGTQWVTLHLAAVENVVDDNVMLEFHGHYADDVRMTLTPAPGSLALLGIGGVLAARRRR